MADASADDRDLRAIIRRAIIGVICTVLGGLVLAYVANQSAREHDRDVKVAALERVMGLVEQRQQNLLEHLQSLQTDRAVRGETLHQMDVRLARHEAQQTTQEQQFAAINHRITALVERMLKFLEDERASPK